MKESNISTTSPLSPGYDLWVLADAEHCVWTDTVDFYIQFQIRKSQFRPSASLSTNLLTIAHHYKLELFEAAAKKSQKNATDLLIHTAEYLPNQWVLAMPKQENWVKNVKQHWKSLQQPSLRIFLPKNITRAEFEKQWGESKTTITFVENTLQASN